MGYRLFGARFASLGDVPDERLTNALNVAKAWKQGNASVGDAMKDFISRTCGGKGIF